MEKFEYILAHDFDRAWLNFELDLPLEPMPDGSANPFYVDRPGNPIAELERALLRSHLQSPKWFLSGHWGCGKSTELYRVSVNPAICAKYWPVHFSIQNVADINNLDYKDVLLAIGGQLFTQYVQSGKALPPQLLNELDSWRGRLEREVIITPEQESQKEMGAKLNAFFGEVALKMKLEPATRTRLRQVIENDVTGLIEHLNLITTAILKQEKRLPLILIDDLDKPDLERARTIFYDHRTTMLQPVCAIVYTVSSPLFYSPLFAAIRNYALFLPNVKLHPQAKTDAHDAEGFRVMRMFVHKRMNPSLIAPAAVERATSMSGGVFREMCRIMRQAIDRASASQRAQVEVEDVERAAASIRGEYRRLLTREQRDLLRDVRERNALDEPDKIAPLLQMLAVLEYANGEPWCDIHPVLGKLLDEMMEDDNHRAT